MAQSIVLDLLACCRFAPESFAAAQRARFLASAYEVHAFIPQGAPVLPDLDSSYRVHFVRTPNNWFGALAACPWAALRWLAKRPDRRRVVLYSGPNIASLFAFVAKFCWRLPWVADFWDHLDRMWQASAARGRRLACAANWLLSKLVGFSIRFADLVVYTPNKQVIDNIRVAEQKTRRVHRAIDLASLAKRRAARTNAPGQFTILSCGLIRVDRGLDMYVGVFERLASEIPELEMQLVGHLPHESQEYLRAWGERTGLGDRVVATGMIPWDQAMDMVAAADVCLCHIAPTSSFDCALPIKLGEYLALGKPTVSSRTSVIAESVVDGVHGLLAEPFNLEEWAEAVRRLHRDAALRHKLAANAPAAATRTDYTLEAVRRQYLEAVASVLGSEVRG